MGNTTTAQWALALACCALGVTPVMASSRKAKPPQPPVACATESPILVADARSASRFSALMACTDIAEVPPVKPQEVATGDDVDFIVERSRREPGAQTSGAMNAIYGGRIAERLPEAGDVRVRSHRAINGMQVVTVAPVVDDDPQDSAAFVAPSAPAPTQPIIAGTSSAPIAEETIAAAHGRAAAPHPRRQPVAYPASSVTRVSPAYVAPAPAAPAPEATTTAYAPQAAAAPMQASFGGMAEAILSLRPRSQRTQFDDTVTQVAHRHRIDPLLLHAVMLQESGYRPQIVSRAGAVGLMQIMPGTGRLLGVAREHLTIPMANIDAGARLLRRLATKYNGNFDLVLAAYNAGEGAVQKYGNRIPPYRETQDYVRRVMANYYRFATETGLLANR